VALWRLPRPDFHRLVDTDFQDTPLTLRPARSRSRLATLYTESSDSFVASAAASIATGWSEPVPGRELHPLKSSAFHGARRVENRRSDCSLPVGMRLGFRLVPSVRVDLVLFPVPAHRTGQADFPHPALRKDTRYSV
jgi:hypothetical protein